MHSSLILAGLLATVATAHKESSGHDHDASVWKALENSVGKRSEPAAEPLSKRATDWNPPANLTTALSETWTHEVDTYAEGLYGFKNYGWDQLMATNGSVNICVRWDSKTTVTAATRAKILAAAKRSYAKWYSWLYGFDNFPFSDIPVNIVGWAVNDTALLQGATNASDGTVYSTYHDDSGVPQCAPACGRYFHQDGDYSECPGGTAQHYDQSLWLTDGFEGGAGGDWGARLGTEYFLAALDQTEMHIYEHEIGHIYGLDDFYDWQPTGETNFIMWAGTSTAITEFDGWMLRNWWYELSRKRGWQSNNTATATATGSTASSTGPVVLPTSAAASTKEKVQATQVKTSVIATDAATSATSATFATSAAAAEPEVTSTEPDAGDYSSAVEPTEAETTAVYSTEPFVQPSVSTTQAPIPIIQTSVQPSIHTTETPVPIIQSSSAEAAIPTAKTPLEPSAGTTVTTPPIFETAAPVFSLTSVPSTLTTKTKTKTKKTKTKTKHTHTKTRTHTRSNTGFATAAETLTSTESAVPTFISRVSGLSSESTADQDTEEVAIDSTVDVDVYVNAAAVTPAAAETSAAVPTTILTSVLRASGSKTVFLESPWPTDVPSTNKSMSLGRLSVCSDGNDCKGTLTCHVIAAGYGICA